VNITKTTKRGNIAGRKVNSKNIKLYNISDQEGRTEIIETREYLREISFDGSQLSWDYAHVKSLGHTIRHFKIGVMGTTSKREENGDFIYLVDGSKLPIKQAVMVNLPIFDVAVRKAEDFDDNIRRIFTQGRAVIHLEDDLVITSMITIKDRVKYLWERISMGEGDSKNYKLALVQVNKVKVTNLSAAKRNNLLNAVGKIALDAACTINTLHTTTSAVACGRI
jgi:hypothetical protein